MRSFLLVSLASLAVHDIHAHPSASTHSTQQLRKRKDDFPFHEVLNTKYINYAKVQSDPSTVPPAQGNPQDTATELVKMTMPKATFRLADDHYVGDNGITHFYFKQTANDLDVDNAEFNVNIGRNGEVFSFGHSFYDGDPPPALRKRDMVEPVHALKTAVKNLELPISADKATAESKGVESFTLKQTSGTVSEPEARLVYVRTATDGLALAWRVETDIDTNWLLTYVDAENGEKIHRVVDYAADATYEVYPWGVVSPAEGSRIVVKDPSNSIASEFGWHGDGTATYKTTRGNNGMAQSNWENITEESEFVNLPRPTSESLAFEYPYDPEEEDWKSYVNASITQLFYTVNKYHDVLYLLGFTEKAGNFQLNNNNKGGKEGDWVYMHVQDGSGVNNANFLTPEDGQPGRLRMYMNTYTTPWRDGVFSIGTVLHEYTHGVSNRLTGGPANSACLEPWEPGAMGEGTSDWFATAVRVKQSDTREIDYPIDAWDTGDAAGARPWVLSTNMTTNPLVYKDADTIPIMHWVGTVWATMLWEVLWNLIDKHGKSDADTPEFNANGVPTDGKYLAIKLVTDGMALQPCNPNYIQARDAILDADQALTGGENQCLIWEGFAKRGLGTGAISYDWKNRTGSFDLPEAC